MRLTATLTLVAMVTGLAAGALATDLPGYDRITVETAHHARPIEGAIWYPAASTTYKTEIGSNPVFKGVEAMQAPVPAEGPFPLVVVSHGSGGNIDNLGWLAAGLVEAGAVVVGVNHPGSTSGDSSPRRTIRHWTRAQDASAALSHVLEHPDFAPLVDPSRISMLGFSFGGFTALSLAGARADLGQYMEYCDTYDEGAMDCIFMAKGGVQFDRLDPEMFAGDLRDARISKTVAVDPGFGFAYTQASLDRVEHPVFLLNFGKTEDLTISINVGPTGSDLAARLPDATYAQVEGANHFTFLAESTPIAPVLLKEEGEDPICDDPDGVDRALAHAEILGQITAFLFD